MSRYKGRKVCYPKASSLERIGKRDGWRCTYCGHALANPAQPKHWIPAGDGFSTLVPGLRAAVRDHVIPRAQGGSNWPENLVLACWECNCKKGARTIQEWIHATG